MANTFIIRSTNNVVPLNALLSSGAKGDPGPSSGGSVASVNGNTGTVVLTQDSVGDGTTYKRYSQTEKTKLSGIATGATANQTDAYLLSLANATGTLPLANLPATVPLFVIYAGGTPVRPTSDTTRLVIWICTTTARPTEVASGTGGSHPTDLVCAPVA